MVSSNNSSSKRQAPVFLLIFAAIVLVVVMVVLGRFCSQAATIDVTVNGTPIALHGAKTLESAMRESGLPINPGDLVSLKGSVLKRGAGHPFYATVNGEETNDASRELHDGDELYFGDGKDAVEEYESEEETYYHTALVNGAGALATLEPGEDGVIEHRKGLISGEEIDRVTKDETETTVLWRIPDVGSDKVIALTFDAGPSEQYTGEVLDILAENDAKATFFCMGEAVEGSPELVRREREEGHQIASNTYDREVTAQTTAEWLVEEMETSFDALSSALGDGVMSRTVRFPEALLTRDMAAAIDQEVDVVVGWDLDTADWMETNANEVYETIMSAKPGNIVAMSDGGGNRSGTLEALRRALPKLKNRGYSFITIDQLMEYPAKES